MNGQLRAGHVQDRQASEVPQSLTKTLADEKDRLSPPLEGETWSHPSLQSSATELGIPNN